MFCLRTMSKGFTLPEVCVALSVLLIGTTALLSCWNFFNREVSDERKCLGQFYKVQSAMESLIVELPPCTDSAALVRTSATSRNPEIVLASDFVQSVRLTRIPGNKHLVWAVIEHDGYSFKRLVRCR
jgi:prepilin-type N-terminal cleavage/methylation domain-containing protein